MLTLKTPQFESIPSALQKAEQYRTLNEPGVAESISLDILQVEPDNQEALILLILAHTDKFKTQINPAFSDALSVVGRLQDEGSQAYYRGIIYERRAKAHLGRNVPDAPGMAYDDFVRAMAEYDKALESKPGGIQDAILRWNTCARIINENPKLAPLESVREVEFTDAYE